MAKREAVRKAIAGLKNYEGLNGKFSFDENGDTTSETMSGFKVVKSDKEPGCTFAVRVHPRIGDWSGRAGPRRPSPDPPRPPHA